MNKLYPIIDMHCDLTSYLVEVPHAHYGKAEDIGCASPHLQQGNVKLQVLAFYTATEKGSTDLAKKQLGALHQLSVGADDFFAVNSAKDIKNGFNKKGTGIVMAIENASGLAEEDAPLEDAFSQLDAFMATGRMAYIGFTHHGENRFGGGNKAQGIGLKDDGKELLDYMSGKKAALDFAHASDALAYDMLNHISKKGLDIPILASHSNFRAVWDHPRNLPTDIAKEIIQQQGVIGMNFLREYVDRKRPEALEEHIMYALSIGGEDSVVFGADYFYVKDFYDESRIPLYFEEHENATSYPPLLERLENNGVSHIQLEKLANYNALQFFEKVWGE